MVLIQFNKHCSTYKLIPDYQSACRANYSFKTALVKIVDNILWAMELQKVTSLMTINLSAAFDTVDQNILLSILGIKFSVHDTFLAWFESYLKPRYCMMNVREAYSLKWELVCSVPQGILGGPSLYIVYASTMQSVVLEETDLHGFVDDYALKNSCKASNRTERESISPLESSAADVKTWMDENRLKMNDGKTRVYYVCIKETTRGVCDN